MNKPVLVMGMHRSGTSVTAGVLHKLGVNMGDNLLRADRHNPDGYYEDMEFLKLNQYILQQHGGDWLRPPEVDTTYEHLVEDTIQKKEGKWGFKDPRTLITWPAYRDVIDPKVVFVERSKEDILDSLQRRQQLDEEIYMNTINTYIEKQYQVADELEPENQLWVDYDELTTKPRRVVEHMARFVDERPVNESAVNLVRT